MEKLYEEHRGRHPSAKPNQAVIYTQHDGQPKLWVEEIDGLLFVRCSEGLEICASPEQPVRHFLDFPHNVQTRVPYSASRWK